MREVVEHFLDINSQYIRLETIDRPDLNLVEYSIFVELPTNGRVLRYSKTIHRSELEKMSSDKYNNLKNELFEEYKEAIINDAVRLWSSNPIAGKKDIELEEKYLKLPTSSKKSSKKKSDIKESHDFDNLDSFMTEGEVDAILEYNIVRED